MATKFQIVSEYEYGAPFIGCAYYDTLEAAKDAAKGFEGLLATKTWIYEISVCPQGTYCGTISETLIYERAAK